MQILLSNDDGVSAPGLRALARSLSGLGAVTVVAPEREQSASSHSLTLDRPLRIRRVEEGFFSVDGTPTDCVLLAVRGTPGVVKIQPDLLVSGINHGPNLGDDVLYSGTVAAAAEGCLMGIPSVAVSLAGFDPKEFETAGAVARSIVDQLLAQAGEASDLKQVIPEGTLLNVNVPDLPLARIRGIRVTHLGRRIYPDLIVKQLDPRGRPFYWIGGAAPEWETVDSTDYAAVSEGYVSVTPLALDITHYDMIDRLRAWNLRLESAP